MPGFGLFRPLFAVMLLVIACSKPAAPPPPPDAHAGPDRHAECCAQCTAAARRDPAGTRLEPTDCRKYQGMWNGRPGVDDDCFLYFRERQTTVGECWEQFPDSK